MPDPDVLVIGGGVVGLFCAYHLRRAGASVAVLERGAAGGPQSCSAGNTGFVGTHGAAPLAEPGLLRSLFRPDGPLYVKPRADIDVLRWLWQLRRAGNGQVAQTVVPVLLDMKKRSLEILRELCASGRLAGTFAAPGMIIAYRTPQGFDQACRAVPTITDRGVPLRILDPGELSDLEPDLTFDIRGATYHEEGAYLRVPEFLREFSQVLRDMGVELHPHTEAVDFEVTGRIVRQVRTTRGDFRPKELVLALGAWSVQCARKLDIGLLLQPVKGYAITVNTPAPRRPVMLGEARMAIAPAGDRLRVGGVRELVGLDATVSRRRVAGMLHAVRRYLPHLEHVAPAEVWTGLRPATPDSLPFVGRAGPYHNLYLACGHGHIGMGLAPASGRLLAQLVAGQRPDMNPAPFRVGRYDKGVGHQR
jgi:D-amino-acid dehydrogenase